MNEIAIIVLAAGSSSRMGQSKQQLLIAGEPLLRRSVKVALAGGLTNVFVVLGANEKSHEKIIQDLPAIIVYNSDWQKGMGNSLKVGLNRVLKLYPETNAIVVMVCDQPKLSSQHLRNLVKTYLETKSKIVSSYYSKTAGVPALFDKSLFKELLLLKDDQGARGMINQYPGLVSKVDFAGGEVDLDTAADYKTFIANS